MKRFLTLLLALFVAFSFPLCSFAEGEGTPFDDDLKIEIGVMGDPEAGSAVPSEAPSAAEEANVPEDAWEGGFVEYKGKDGSITTVYDNGSVKTTYADGSKDGVDYQGNTYSMGKDGTYTVRTTNGFTATEYKDGRTSLSEPDGKTTTINPDGSFTESYKTFGISIDYNADGGKTGIGFTGSSERIGVDEYGVYQDGEIHGPNGATLSFSGNEKHLVTSDGLKVDYKESGITDSSDGYTESFTITSKDGTRQYWDVNTTALRDEQGVFAGERKSNTGGIDLPDGTKFQYEGAVTFDQNGNPVYSDQNVSQFTGSDGSTLWRDNNSKALEYRDPNTGATFIVDKNGNLLENKSDEVDFKATYDENGNLVSADIKWADGAHQVQNPDGTASFTLPDGTQYVSDGQGNVWKDGEQIKTDGQWMNGAGDSPGENDAIRPEEIVGTWNITATFSNMESPLIGLLQNFFDRIFGEGAGDDIVESNLGDSTSGEQVAVIEQVGGGKMRVTITSEDTVMVYEGNLNQNVLKLKLVSQSGEDGEVMIPINNLTYTFVRRGADVVIDGTCRIKETLFKADLHNYGVKQ